jgi:hypothetical protein
MLDSDEWVVASAAAGVVADPGFVVVRDRRGDAHSGEPGQFTLLPCARTLSVGLMTNLIGAAVPPAVDTATRATGIGNGGQCASGGHVIGRVSSSVAAAEPRIRPIRLVYAKPRLAERLVYRGMVASKEQQFQVIRTTGARCKYAAVCVIWP